MKEVQTQLSETRNLFPHLQPFKNASPLQIGFMLCHSTCHKEALPRSSPLEQVSVSDTNSYPETWKLQGCHHTCSA